MSNEEDIALRELVAQTLDARGVLPKIRAELRANVFLALDETGTQSLTQNPQLSAFAKATYGPVTLNLVREFLQFFNLDFTLSVFNPESRCNNEYQEMTRKELLEKLSLSVPECDSKMPLLWHLVQSAGAEQSLAASPCGLNATFTKQTSQPASVTPEHDSGSSSIAENILQTSNKDESGRLTPTNFVDAPPDESFNLLVFTPISKSQQPQSTAPAQDSDKLPPLPVSTTHHNILHARKLLEQQDEWTDEDVSSHVSSCTENPVTEDETVSSINHHAASLDHVEAV